MASSSQPDRDVVIIEPFSGGSHQQLVRWLSSMCGRLHVPCNVVTLPAKKWHWRLRAGALWAASNMPSITASSTVFVSSMLNLAEMVGLRPDLHTTRKILYFHENQLAFPVRSAIPAAGSVASSATVASVDASASKPQQSFQGDFQYGWANIASALCADVVVFNSEWNLESFLAGIDKHMRTIPDQAQRVPGLQASIRAKSVVAYFPVNPPVSLAEAHIFPTRPLTIGWNHRHEFDKNPAAFFDSLRWLHEKRIDFRVVVLGETFAEEPPEFAEARVWLETAGKVLHWGYAESVDGYQSKLSSCDVAISTADHEFFGVSMLEAALAGAFPLCPARLSYPEVFAPTPEQRERTSAAATVQRVHAILSAPRPLFGGTTTGGTSAGQAPESSGGSGERRRGDGGPVMPAPPPSPHLYKSDRDLRQRLYAMAKDPSAVRAWRAAMWGPAPGPSVDEENAAASATKKRKIDGNVDHAEAGLSPHEATSMVSEASAAQQESRPAVVGAVNSLAGLTRETLQRFSTGSMEPVYRALLGI